MKPRVAELQEFKIFATDEQPGFTPMEVVVGAEVMVGDVEDAEAGVVMSSDVELGVGVPVN